MHFLDELTITVRSGKGGDGKLSFLREKSRPWGGPDGGDGGRGGSVWLEADANLNTFYPLKMKKFFAAPDGADGGSLNCTGKSGLDFVIHVPVGTLVRPRGGAEILADLDVAGKRWRAAKGGKGGLGNQNFATPTNQAPQRADPGQPGEEHVFDIELKLLADAGLLGLPNAGKSTFLSRVSAARPKIADYPFTTLIPNLGVVAGPNYRTMVIADIPGLIEGAHHGQGLGDQFLRHVDRTKLLIHLVDLSPFAMEPPLAAVKTIEAELRAYSPELASRPRILVGTKIDAGRDEKAVAALEKYAAGEGLRFFMISAHTGAGLQPLLNLLWESLDHPDRLQLEKPARVKPAAREKPATAARNADQTAARKPAGKKPARKKNPRAAKPGKKTTEKKPHRKKIVRRNIPVQKPGKARARGDRRKA
jgi:GTP-binding protein